MANCCASGHFCLLWMGSYYWARFCFFIDFLSMVTVSLWMIIFPPLPFQISLLPSIKAPPQRKCPLLLIVFLLIAILFYLRFVFFLTFIAFVLKSFTKHLTTSSRCVCRHIFIFQKTLGWVGYLLNVIRYSYLIPVQNCYPNSVT